MIFLHTNLFMQTKLPLCKLGQHLEGIWTTGPCLKELIYYKKIQTSENVNGLMNERNEGLEVVCSADGLENIPESCNAVLVVPYCLEDPLGKLAEESQVKIVAKG